MSVLASSPDQPRPTVVVAEDGVDTLTMLGLMLELRGFDVVLTVDGRDALAAVLAHRPAAVVSDMNMPHLDGLELCRALRALPEGASLPVVLWSSAGSDDPRMLEALALGSVECLSKAVAISEVDDVLRRMLSQADVSAIRSEADPDAIRGGQRVEVRPDQAAA
jgi:CheY-like chemotaxis protein